MDNGEVVQTRVYCSHGDQLSINVRHYLVSAKAGTGATLAQFNEVLSAEFPALYKALLSGNAVYEGLDSQVISPILGMPTGTNTGSDAGDVAGASLPLQTSGLIKLRTNFGGQAFRGRVYVPFPSEVDNDVNGDPTLAYVTALGDLAASLIAVRAAVGAGGNTNTLTPVLLHRDTGLTTPITGGLPRIKWATQRRRGKFGRPNTVPL